MSYQNWRDDDSPEDSIILNKKYAVHADISKCFPSIYTHSISWALVGKEVAKSTMKNLNTYYGKLDHLIQINKDLETHGLLIGPHISNILSEIILCAVDYELVEKGWQYVRRIDDYSAYVETEVQAEQFLTDLQAELRKYDLSINHKKTKIEKLPLAMTEQWTRRIIPVDILTSYGKVDYKKCRSYLDTAVEIAESENWNSAVLNWAIKALSSYELTDNAKQYEKNMIFHLTLNYPYLVSLLEEYVFAKCDATDVEIKNLSNLLYISGMNNRKYEQVSYAVYFAMKYNFNLDISYGDIIDTGDCVLLTLVLMYFRKMKEQCSIDALVNYADSIVQRQIPSDIDQMWLFVYEALPEHKLIDDWKYLKRQGITFLKSI